MSGEERKNFRIAAAKSPSFERWRNLFLGRKGVSVLRALQYEMLACEEFPGRLLDFGGGEKVSYRDLLKTEAYHAVNIDPAIVPTWLVAEGAEIPVADAFFDCALSMNTLEHIFEPRFCLREIGRVLKSGGRFVAAVPFLFPVHGHPDDFFRPTPGWWREALSDAGFEKVEIFPMFWGPFTTGAVTSALPGPLKRARLHAALLLDILYKSFAPNCRTLEVNHALGYYVRASKKAG